ncbi:hypothetical protein HZS_6610 [Henneguya salminicola]|nr:hypothetical protein HZS_6610 [Henneguya salminicola]
MEDDCQIWIDSGYIGGIYDHQFIDIDISEYIGQAETRIESSKSKISSGSYGLIQNDKIFPDKFYHWYSYPDIIQIDEYLFNSNKSIKFTLIIRGSSSFHSEMFFRSTENFFYIIFGFSTYLTIITFRIDKISQHAPLFSFIKDKTFLGPRLKFFNIQSNHFWGKINSSLNCFTYFSVQDYSFQIYNLQLPPNNPPEHQTQISLKNSGIGFLSDLLSVVPSLKTNSPKICLVKFLHISDTSYTIFYVSQDATCHIISNTKTFMYSLSSRFSQTANENLILPESTISSLVTPKSIFIGVCLITHHKNIVFIFSHCRNSPLINLDLVKEINCPSSIISIQLHPRFIIAVSNSNMIRLSYISYKKFDTFWHSFEISNQEDFLHESIISNQDSIYEFDKLFYFSHIFSQTNSHTFLGRCIKSFDENKNCHVKDFDRADFMNFFQEQIKSIHEEDCNFELNTFTQNLTQFQKMLESSVECVAYYVRDEYIFVCIPHIGIRVAQLVYDPQPILHINLCSIYAKHFSNKTLIRSLISYQDHDNAIKFFQKNVLSTEFLNNSFILQQIYNHFVEKNLHIFLRSINHETISQIESFVSSMLPCHHPFLQETSIIEFKQNQKLLNHFCIASNVLTNSILHISSIRIQMILTSILILEAFSYGIQKSIIPKNTVIPKYQIDKLIDNLIPILEWWRSISFTIFNKQYYDFY